MWCGAMLVAWRICGCACWLSCLQICGSTLLLCPLPAKLWTEWGSSGAVLPTLPADLWFLLVKLPADLWFFLVEGHCSAYTDLRVVKASTQP